MLNNRANNIITNNDNFHNLNDNPLINLKISLTDRKWRLELKKFSNGNLCSCTELKKYFHGIFIMVGLKLYSYGFLKVCISEFRSYHEIHNEK